MEDLLIFLGIVVVSVAWEKLKKALSNAGKTPPAPTAPVEEDEPREEGQWDSAPAAEEALPGEARSGHGGWNDVPAWDETEAEEPEYVPSQPDPSPVPEARSRLEEILRRLAEAQTVEAEPEETPAADEEAVPSPAAAREETGSLEDDRPIWDIHSEEQASRETHPAWEPRAALRSPARSNRLALDRAGLRDGILWSVVLGKPRGLQRRYPR